MQSFFGQEMRVNGGLSHFQKERLEQPLPQPVKYKRPIQIKEIQKPQSVPRPVTGKRSAHTMRNLTESLKPQNLSKYALQFDPKQMQADKIKQQSVARDGTPDFHQISTLNKSSKDASRAENKSVVKTVETVKEASILNNDADKPGKLELNIADIFRSSSQTKQRHHINESA